MYKRTLGTEAGRTGWLQHWGGPAGCSQEMRCAGAVVCSAVLRYATLMLFCVDLFEHCYTHATLLDTGKVPQLPMETCHPEF